MKHIYLLFCVLSFNALQSQTINFSDANFKAKLLQSNINNEIAHDFTENPMTIDVNGDGEIQLTEAQNVLWLNVNNSNITDLTGISSFPNLTRLRCSNNALTSLIIDNSITIWALNASHNNIGAISVNFHSDVDELDLSYNNLTSFAVDGSNFWDNFNLSHNQLSSLSLGSGFYGYANLANNSLSQIDFSGNPFFAWSANFSHNQFNLLDLSAAAFDAEATIVLGYNLEDVVLFNETGRPGNLYYSSNTTSLDLGNFHGVSQCDPEQTGSIQISNSPNLQNIILKNGLNYSYVTCDQTFNPFQISTLRSLQISNCPNLTQICGDPGELPVIQDRINQLGLQNQVQVNSNCVSSLAIAESPVSPENFMVFPVPATNILQLSVRDGFSIESTSIINNLGQIIKIQMGSATTIDVSGLAQGSYFLRIKSGEIYVTKQFVKQ